MPTNTSEKTNDDLRTLTGFVQISLNVQKTSRLKSLKD